MIRAVPLDEEQYLFIEELGKALMREGDLERSSKLLAIALAWRIAPQVRGGTTEAGWSQGTRRRPAESFSPGRLAAEKPTAPFTCDVDESAGLAEVYRLDPWSRKVPCE